MCSAVTASGPGLSIARASPQRRWSGFLSIAFHGSHAVLFSSYTPTQTAEVTSASQTCGTVIDVLTAAHLCRPDFEFLDLIQQ